MATEKVPDKLWHQIRRAAGVISVVIVLIGPFFMGYTWGMKRGIVKGLEKGVMECEKRVTYDITGPTTIEAEGKVQEKILGLHIWKLGLGFTWRK